MKEIYTFTIFFIFLVLTGYYYKNDEIFLHKITMYIVLFTVLLMFFKYTKDLGGELEEKNKKTYKTIEEKIEEEKELRKQEVYNEITSENVVWKITK